LILGANNPIFRAMLFPLQFSSDSKTATYSTAGPDAKDIVIDDVSPAAFKKMLTCIYTDEIEVTSEDVTELIALAKRFQVDALKAVCVEFMELDVTAEKACTLFVEGRKLLNEPAFGLTFIEENIEDVVKSDGFVDLPKDCLETILRSGKLAIDEADLWTAVDKWAAAQVKRAGKKVDGPNKREALGNALQLIRFPQIEMTDLCTKVQPTNVLTQEELLSLFTYSAAPEDAKPRTTFIARDREGGGKCIVEEFEWSSKLSNAARVRCEGQKVVSIAPTCNQDVLAIAETKGWSSGVHFWRVNIAQGGCYRRVGVVDGEFDKSKYGGNLSQQFPLVLGATQQSWGINIGSATRYGEPNVFDGVVSSFPTGEIGLMLDVKKGQLHVFSPQGQFLATAFSNIKGKKLRPALQMCHSNSYANVLPKKGVKAPDVPKKK